MVIGGGKEIPLNTISPYGVKVPPSGVLDMNGDPHLTIGYLPTNKREDLESKSYS